MPDSGDYQNNIHTYLLIYICWGYSAKVYEYFTLIEILNLPLRELIVYMDLFMEIIWGIHSDIFFQIFEPYSAGGE